MKMLVVPSLKMTDDDGLKNRVLATFTLKPSVGSLANAATDQITDLMLIGSAPLALDVVWFSDESYSLGSYLGGHSIKVGGYRPIFASLIAEYHGLRIPIKASGNDQLVFGALMLPPNHSYGQKYDTLKAAILKIGVEQA